LDGGAAWGAGAAPDAVAAALPPWARPWPAPAARTRRPPHPPPTCPFPSPDAGARPGTGG
ncbi:hypothetical protein AB0J46_35805, partial [Nonomuraea sp. NPDC049758]